MVVQNCKLVIIGGSAGSIDVLLKLLPELDHELPFAIVIVLHRKNTSDSYLQELLASRTNIKIKEVEDKDEICPGNIYIAPPDYHLLFEKENVFCLDDSEKINYSRPSIDVSFESAAEVYRKNLTGILLSGANADGTAGLNSIKENGGMIVAQKPGDAEVSFMPQQAISHTDIDLILNADQIAAFINSLANK